MDKQNWDEIPESDVVVKHIGVRFRHGLNTNLFIIGLSGTGKSSTSFRIAELVIGDRPKEKLQMFVCDSLLKLLESMKKAKQGDIIIVEEVSVLFPSRRSMARENVAINKVFDTCRKRRLCIISNCPLWKATDSHIRSMGHILIQTLQILKTEGIVISKFFKLQTNPSSSKTYTHTMTRDGKLVHRMYTRMPNAESWKEYEKKKDEFMEELYAELKHEQVKKLKKRQKEMGILQPKVKELTVQELEVHNLYNIKGQTQQEIAKKLGVCRQRVTQLVKQVANKSKIPKE